VGRSEVVGDARETVEVGEAGDGGAAQGRAVDRPGWRSDRLPLFRGQSDRLGSWSDRQPLLRGRSDRQPLFCGRSDRLGLRSDRQPLFHVRSNRLGSRSNRQQRSAVESPMERGAPVVVRACEPLRESHPAVSCLNR
jgi:hypothetical protein